MRAIRFAATLNFQLDAQTADAIRQMASQITVVSAERITQEWKRMLIHSNRLQALQLAAETHLLEHVFPESIAMLGNEASAR